MEEPHHPRPGRLPRIATVGSVTRFPVAQGRKARPFFCAVLRRPASALVRAIRALGDAEAGTPTRRPRIMIAVGWYSVRCALRVESAPPLFEERITIWEADSADGAIARAEKEVREYASTLGMRYLGLAQSYELPDPPTDGVEVFSLVRESDLADEAYLDSFSDTGTERQRSA